MSARKSRSSLVDRLKASLPARVIGAYGASQAGNFASGVAFNAFMAMFPLILGILAIVGLATRNPDVDAKVREAILGAFPADAYSGLAAALKAVHDSAGILGIISLLGLLWTGTNFFAALEFALGQVFGVPQRDFLRQRAMGAVMMVLLVIAIVVAVGANTLMNLVPFMAAFGPLLALATMVTLMVLVYRFVPNRNFRLADVWPGAVVAGTLIEVITLAFPLYGKLAHGFNTYGSGFALFFLLATWLSLVSQFILLGAIWNRVRDERRAAPGTAASPGRESQALRPPIPAIGDQSTGLTPAGAVSAARHPRRSPLLLLGTALAAFLAILLTRRRFGP